MRPRAPVDVTDVRTGTLFERANRSMAVAIAFHAGGHLDHIELAPRSEVRLHVMNLLVVAVAAVIAGRALVTEERREPAPG